VRTSRALRLLVACVGVSGLFLVGGSGPAWALDVYGIKVTPSLSYAGEYDDNVFRTPSDRRSDYVNTISPAILLEAAPGKHEIKAGYKLDILRYSTHSNLDTERHAALLSALLNFNRLQVRFREEFRRTDDFPTSELTTRIKRNENFLLGGFDYDVVQLWGVGFDLTWGNINYLDSPSGDFNFLDRNSHTYAATVYHRITAKTRLFAEYDYVREIFDSDQSRDNSRHRTLLGVRGDLTTRFSLTAKGGYERLDFHSDTREAQNNFVISAEASYKPVERLQVALLVKRSVESSTFADNAQFESFNATLGITYAVTPKILIVPRGFFGIDNFRESTLNIDRIEKRLDHLYGGGIGIRYDLQRWIRLDASYDYQARSSNFNAFDYDDNRLSFSVAFSL